MRRSSAVRHFPPLVLLLGLDLDDALLSFDPLLLAIGLVRCLLLLVAHLRPEIRPGQSVVGNDAFVHGLAEPLPRCVVVVTGAVSIGIELISLVIESLLLLCLRELFEPLYTGPRRNVDRSRNEQRSW